MDSTLSFLFNQSSDFFCVLNKDGIIVQFNQVFRKVMGYTETELAGKKVKDFLHPADVKRSGELLKKLSVNHNVSGHEGRIKAKNGRYYNIRWSAALNPADKLIYATGVNMTQDFNDHEDTTDTIQHIIQSFNDGFFIINRSWQVTAFNPAFQAITGLKSDELKNINLSELNNLGITDAVRARLETAMSGDISSQVQYFNAYFKRWLRVNIFPYKDEAAVFIRDITGVKTQQQILALEKKVLELNTSSQYTLAQTVNELLEGVEEIYPDMVCCVLEVDEAQETLYYLASPRLPEEYCRAVNESAIGAKAGSCGTAAFHRSQVIVNDIESSPLWDDYKHLVLPAGIRACWSAPIISSGSAHILATFAVYYTEKREPRSEEFRMIERTANILRILIENKRNQDHVKDQTKRLQEIAAISSHELRRPVATILGLVSLFDRNSLDNPMNKDIINHLDITAQELDEVIHTIVEKTIFLKGDL